jgi:DNA-binding beta-propeller fold protein YncE
MNPLRFARTGAVIAFALSFGLQGCSGNSFLSAVPAATSSGLVPSGRPSLGWLSARTKQNRLLYVADPQASDIMIYPQGEINAQPIGEISEGIAHPFGITVDRRGTLFVANAGNATVTEYPAGSTTPSVTLSDGISDPIAVTVDSAGRVYVSESAAGTILEFSPTGLSPKRKTTKLSYPDGMITDASDTLYATYSNSPPPSGVAKCASKLRPCVKLSLETSLAADVKLDLQGDIAVADDDASKVDIFSPDGSQLLRTIDAGYSAPQEIALDPEDRILYLADFSYGSADLYDYKSGQEIGSVTAGLQGAAGVALYPAQRPGP